MTIAHLLPDRAEIRRRTQTFADGQRTSSSYGVVAGSRPCRVSLATSGRRLAIAGQEAKTFDTVVWFNSDENVLEGDEIHVSGEVLEVVRVVLGGGAPYRAAQCRREV